MPGRPIKTKFASETDSSLNELLCNTQRLCTTLSTIYIVLKYSDFETSMFEQVISQANRFQRKTV